MPARNKRFSRPRKRRFQEAGPKKREIGFKIKKLIFLGAFLIALFILSKLSLAPKYWEVNNKLSVAIQETGGDVSIYVFDPPRGEITQITIPGNTEVEVAENLGVWKLRSVWDLGKNEKLGGRLLAKTLTSHFKLPVYAWGDYHLTDLVDGSPMSILTPTSTNLSMGDRINIFLFTIKVKNVDREEINMVSTNILKRSVLKDGENGYVLSGFDSPRVSSKFSDYGLSGKTARVHIKDKTGRVSVAPKVGEILEVLGAKVSSITREPESELTCEVSGGREFQKVVARVALFLGCLEKEHDGNFDLVITLGKGY